MAAAANNNTFFMLLVLLDFRVQKYNFSAMWRNIFLPCLRHFVFLHFQNVIKATRMKTKKTFLIFAAILGSVVVMCLAGCSKNKSELIVGTWEVYSVGTAMIENLTPSLEMKFTFNQDKTGVMIEKWSGIDGSGSTTTLFTYTIDGDSGIITTETNNPDYFIQEITEKEITIVEEAILINYDAEDPCYSTVKTLFHCKKI